MEEFKELFAEAIKPYEERLKGLEEKDKLQCAEIATLKHAIAHLDTLIESGAATPASSGRSSGNTARTGLNRPQTASARRTAATTNNNAAETPTTGSSSRIGSGRTSGNTATEDRKVTRTGSRVGAGTGIGSGAKKTTGGPTTTTRVKTDDLAAEGAIEADFGRSSYWVFPPEDYKTPEDAKKKPEANLVLDWVQGFNGRTCRNNLFWIDDHRVVFSLAGTGVVMDLTAEPYTQTFFTGHNEDITSLALHRESGLCATGQLDPKGAETPFICVWNVNSPSDEPLKLYKHDRAVPCVGFSQCGKFLVSTGGDNDHTICIWNLEECRSAKTPKPLIVQSCEKSNIHGVSVDPTSTAEVLRFVTHGEKTVKFWTFESGKLEGKKGTLGTTGDMPKHYYGATYDSKGTCYLGTDIGIVYVFVAGATAVKSKWKYSETVPVSVKIFTVEGEENESLLTAGYDGKFIVWDLDGNQKETKDIATSEIIERLPEGTLFKPKSLDVLGNNVVFGTVSNALIKSNLAGESHLVSVGHSNEFWGLWAHPIHGNLYITCGFDKNLSIWDTNARGSKSLLRSVTMDQKAKACNISPDGKTIAVGLLEGQYKIFDFETLEPLKEDKVSEKTKETINQVRYSPDGSWLAVAISSKIFLYKVEDNYKKTKSLSGNTGHVTHICFSKDGKYLISNSNDYQILTWEVSTGERITKLSQTRNDEWASYTLVNAWGSIGVWDPDYDGTDVNAACTSNDNSLLAIGDDFGKVKVFRFPSSIPEAESLDLLGHSAHVTNVTFTSDDSFLISTGGNDTGIFLWKKEDF